MELSKILSEKLSELDGNIIIKSIIETNPAQYEYLLQQLYEMNIYVNPKLISRPIEGGNYYIPALIPASKINDVMHIQGVICIHKSVPRAMGCGGVNSDEYPALFKINDELFGNIEIPAISSNTFAPTKLLGCALSPFFRKYKDFNVLTTEQVYDLMKLKSKNKGKGVRVAVIDTGSNKLCVNTLSDNIEEYTIISEPPFDLCGHGSHVCNTIFGNPWDTKYGHTCGGAPNSNKVSIKALNILGKGSTSSLLKATELAIQSGSKVINMSLGGPLQGNPIDQDLECRIVNDASKKGIIFVVAAGNSGSKLYSIGSPGGALNALTVGSVSHTDKDRPSCFSSRLQSGWYHDRPDEMEYHLKKYKDDFIKPDCVAYGGGASIRNNKYTEHICSISTGWMDSLYDKTFGDMSTLLHGTSQSTPFVSGIVACAVSDGIIDNVFDIKRALKSTSDGNIPLDPIHTQLDKTFINKYGKSISSGWGMFSWDRLLK